MAFLVTKVISGNRRAGVRVRVRDFNLVFIYMIFMRVMEMAIMDVVDVIAVAHGRVAASGSMLMGVVLVLWIIACGHHVSPDWSRFQAIFPAIRSRVSSAADAIFLSVGRANVGCRTGQLRQN
ncbi:MAG: hypothetical protein AB3N24_00620 [Leisingera sp.]